MRNMLKSSRKRRAPWSAGRRQRPSRAGPLGADPRRSGSGLDELEHEDAALGEVGDDLRADSRVGCRDGVLVLVLPVDGEEASVLRETRTT
jgi:hypothetical protein